MLQVADRDAGLLGDVVEAQPLLLARDAQPLADRVFARQILVRLGHQLYAAFLALVTGRAGNVNRSVAVRSKIARPVDQESFQANCLKRESWSSPWL
jgi:hypothetical protein